MVSAWTLTKILLVFLFSVRRHSNHLCSCEHAIRWTFFWMFIKMIVFRIGLTALWLDEYLQSWTQLCTFVCVKAIWGYKLNYTSWLVTLKLFSLSLSLSLKIYLEYLTQIFSTLITTTLWIVSTLLLRSNSTTHSQQHLAITIQFTTCHQAAMLT